MDDAATILFETPEVKEVAMIAIVGICLVAISLQPKQEPSPVSNSPVAVVARTSPPGNAFGENSKHRRKSDRALVTSQSKPAATTQPSESAVGHFSLGSMHAFPRLSGFTLPRR